jgi:transposase-like protein
MNDLFNLLKGIAPTLATAVAGPLGGAAVSAIASRLGVSDSVSEVAKAIAGDPAAAQKIAELELEMTKVAADAMKNEDNNISTRWSADMASDSWLSKNIRPMSLVAIFIGYFLFAMMSAFGLNANEAYVTLLGQWGMLIMGAYFGGRTVEKLAEMRKK